MLDLAAVIPSPLVESLSLWFSLWGLPSFDKSITINFSTRLQRTLGRCYARRRRITVAARLKEMHPSILEEVLCHECAHLAVFELQGESCRPHGREWGQFMTLAGFEPRRRLLLDELGISSPNGRHRYVYIHSCPICQAKRVARRPVRSWRCADCMALGLDGLLEINRRSSQQGIT